MKKIPTLFKRIYHNASHLTTTDELSPGLEWVLEGRGVATVKYDGTCCAVKSGRFYRRLIRHGADVIRDCPRTFMGLRDYLYSHNIEGIVFWLNGEPMCKIKRSDFGFKWPSD